MSEQFNAFQSLSSESEAGTSIEVWLTTADQQALFDRQASSLGFNHHTGDLPVIVVDTGKNYQPIEGFGFS